MNLPAPVTGLTTAQPGWTVSANDLQTGDPVNCPIVAWASVMDAPSETTLCPVFVAHGRLWTDLDYPVGPQPTITPPQP
ncbi:hypothetical protein [Streptomyces virginiae]|uniref:hypothetical protein n=1 Tax=Streptomyces virginiae TaxID=1961 RepID=UPI003448662C